VMVWSNGVWKPVMHHPIYSGIYAKPGFRSTVARARRKPGTLLKYNGVSFKVEA
jgi:hypothetical protein